MDLKSKKYFIMSMVLYVAATAVVFRVMWHYWTAEDQKSIYIKKRELSGAELRRMEIDPIKIKLVEDYIDRRLLSAQSLLISKNGTAVLENYYWDGKPEKRAFVHSINLNIIQVLIEIAINKRLLENLNQPLSYFFPGYQTGRLTVEKLLEIETPLMWGEKNPEYWKLFYADDKVSESLRIINRNRKNPAAKYASIYLLSEIIKKASSMSVYSFADKQLFSRIGIESSSWQGKANNSAGEFLGFMLKGMDLARFGEFVLNNGYLNGKKLIKGKTSSAEVDPGLRVNADRWKAVKLAGKTAYLAEGEGGQYVVLIPEIGGVISVTSRSEFPLQKNSGYLKMFEMITDALSGARITGGNILASYEDEDIFYEPNFIISTEVPGELRKFFISFARDIHSEDLYRIRYNYAKAYKFGLRKYDRVEDIWKTRFFGGPAHLESVEINKARIDKNRAYVRGMLKYSFHNMSTGSIGFFPVVSMIKLKGKWRWLGTPEKVKILDREEYFDAEMDDEIAVFIKECSSSLAGVNSFSQTKCISDSFSYKGSGLKSLSVIIRSMLKDPASSMLHLTDIKKSGDNYTVNGYYDDSITGKLPIPPDMKIVKKGNRLLWEGGANSSPRK